MPLTLNTSHPLYGNLKAFICVDSDNAIKDLVNTGVTFTKDAAVTIGTGTYGKHFRTLSNGFSPTLVTPAGGPSVAPTNQTILLVFNNVAGGAGGNPAPLYSGAHATAFQRTSGGTTGISFGRWNSFWGRVDFTSETPSTLANGAHSVAVTRTGTTAHALFRDGAAVSSGAGLGNDNGAAYFGPFGGQAGVASVGADFVYAMIFDKALSLAEYQGIASSLGANNAISLLTTSGGGDTTPPVITGPGGATGATSSVSIPENTTAVHTFTANEAVTWSLNGGADVAKFAINSGSGALSFLAAPDFETPTDANADNVYVVGVRATDAAAVPNSATQTVSVTVTNVSEGGGGSFTTVAMENNTRTGVLANQAVVYSYVAGGRVGSMGGKTVFDGTGTTSAAGTLTVSGLPTGTGVVQVAVLGATPADDQVFYQPVTVA
jgi:hypothetical protein